MHNLIKVTLSSVAMLTTSTALLHADVSGAASASVHKTPAATVSADTAMMSPATTMWATRGLTQIASAEPLGAGRLTFNLTGTWYKQDVGYPTVTGVPSQDADVMTGVFAASFGINPYFDVFATAAGYGIFAGDNSEQSKGSICGGIQGSLPLPGLSPLRLGAQLSVIGGISTSPINRNNADGYDYFNTRIYYDFVGRIMESLMFGNDSLGIKFHFNQGAAMMLQNENRKLLLLGAGIQGSVHPMIVIGLELNSRTSLDSLNVRTDPLWLTPSVLVRTPYYFNAELGIDVSVSKARPLPTARALEPFRLFGGLIFSFDLLAEKRRAEREKALREKVAMEKRIQAAQRRSALIARKAKLDSIAMAKSREEEQRKADSLAQKAREDSIAMADLKLKLEEERSKRSDAEKQLLSTGLLILDAVYFQSGKSQISINSFPYLNIIGKMLTKYPKLQIEVSGHTDNIGKYDRNIVLSQARGEAVRRYLIQVAPELLTRISARGYGPTQPKAPNSTAEGRKMNRRVELQVLNKEVLKEYN
jgi:outer membrane protein OmpA-like peptidoglycan-associated protein